MLHYFADFCTTRIQ